MQQYYAYLRSSVIFIYPAVFTQHYTYLCSSIMLIYAAVLYLFTQQYLRSIILIYAAALIYYYTASCEVPASIINIKLSACVYETALVQNPHVMASSS